METLMCIKTIEKLPHQTMPAPPLYKLNANLKRLTKTRLAARLPAFDTAMEPIIRAILANNTNAGVAVKRGRFGKSMFAKKAIHRNTRLFLYWGDVVDADAYSGPLTYAYGTDISGNHAGAVFVEGKGREKEFVRGRKWRRVWPLVSRVFREPRHRGGRRALHRLQRRQVQEEVLAQGRHAQAPRRAPGAHGALQVPQRPRWAVVPQQLCLRHGGDGGPTSTVACAILIKVNHQTRRDAKA